MKFITLISSFVLALGLTACSKEEVVPAPAAATPAPAAPASTPAPAQTEEKK